LISIQVMSNIEWWAIHRQKRQGVDSTTRLLHFISSRSELIRYFTLYHSMFLLSFEDMVHFAVVQKCTIVRRITVCVFPVPTAHGMTQFTSRMVTTELHKTGIIISSEISSEILASQRRRSIVCCSTGSWLSSSTRSLASFLGELKDCRRTLQVYTLSLTKKWQCWRPRAALWQS